MPLLKTVEQTAEHTITDHPTPTIPFVSEGIPLDIYSFFETSSENSNPKEKDKLRDVYEFIKGRCEEPTLGNILHSLSVMESKLGLGGYAKRLDRVWNYVRLSRQVDELDKRRKSMEKQWL